MRRFVMDTAPKLYDMDYAAAHFGKARSTIERWVRTGKLTGSKPAGQWYFTDADFIAFEAAGRNAPTGEAADVTELPAPTAPGRRQARAS
jgi:hypothetical protein